MQFTLALAALAAVAYAAPQATDNSGAVTAAISPTGSAPATAQTSYPSAFQLTVVNVTTSATKAKVSNYLLLPASEANSFTASIHILQRRRHFDHHPQERRSYRL